MACAEDRRCRGLRGRELSATAGEEFTRRLDRHELPAAGPQRWQRPVAGEALRLECEAMDLPAGEGQQRLLVLVPADEVTGAALDRLNWGEAGGLRAVR